MAPIFITIMEQSNSESEFRNTAILGIRITEVMYIQHNMQYLHHNSKLTRLTRPKVCEQGPWACSLDKALRLCSWKRSSECLWMGFLDSLLGQGP